MSPEIFFAAAVTSLFFMAIGTIVLYYVATIAKDVRAMRENAEAKFIGGSAGSSPQPQR
jgi:hypothetical protein